MARIPDPLKQALPVLSIGDDFVEWLSGAGEESRFAREPALGESPVELARAAVRVVKSTGMHPGACILSLGQGMVEQRSVKLPGMAPKELRKVLARKAANLVESEPGDTLFSCRPLGGHGDDEQDRWLVFAMRRARSTALRLELRRRGFRVQRVVMGRQAFLAAADETHESEDSSCIVVGVETASISVSLTDGPDLIQQSILPGAFTEATAPMLVQELRGFEAFWRKTSRGKKLDRVVVVGLDAHLGQALESGLMAALPGVDSAFVPPIARAPLHSSRAEALASARSASPFQLDLTLPLPPSRAGILVTAFSMTVLAGVIGFVSRDRMLSARDGWRAEVLDLQAQLLDLDAIEDSHALIDESIGSLRAETERLAAVATEGVPMETMLGEALTAFEDHAVLLSIAGENREMGFDVSMTGATTGDPLTGVDALESLRARLEASEMFHNVVVIPPTGVPDLRDMKSLRRFLSFGVRATATMPLKVVQ